MDETDADEKNYFNQSIFSLNHKHYIARIRGEQHQKQVQRETKKKTKLVQSENNLFRQGVYTICDCKQTLLIIPTTVF